MATKRCAWGTCSNDSRLPHLMNKNANGDEVVFFHIPGAKYHEEKRRRWIQACHRGDGFVCTKYSYICSIHFVGENSPTADHPDPISAVKSAENAEKMKKRCKDPVKRSYSPPKKRRMTKIEAAKALLTLKDDNESIDTKVTSHSSTTQPSAEAKDSNDTPVMNTSSDFNWANSSVGQSTTKKDAVTQTAVTIEHLELYTSKELVNFNEMKKSLFLSKVMDNSKHYTGLSRECITLILNIVQEKATRLNRWKGAKKTAKSTYDVISKTQRNWVKLSVKEQLLFTLVKLKRNPSLLMMCDLFGISTAVGSNLFITWVLFLEKELVIFLPFSTVKDMEGIPRPEVFAGNPCLRAVIDCTELFIHKPSLPSSQRRTHSSYKSRNTFKLFLSISPLLHINFVSRLYNGCISDKEITRKCGFIEALEPGDAVMADKGFNIQDLLAQQHVCLIAPPLMHKGNINAASTTKSRRVARKRIHIERIIRSLKSFSIISGVIPLTMKSYIDSVVTVCAALVNLQPKIIAEENDD